MSLPTDPIFELFIRPGLSDEMRKAFERAENMLAEIRPSWEESADQLERVAKMASETSQVMRKTSPDKFAEYIAALQERVFLMERALNTAGIPVPELHDARTKEEEAPKPTCDFCGGDNSTPEMPEGVDFGKMLRNLFPNATVMGPYPYGRSAG